MAILDRGYPARQLRLGDGVASLTGAVDVEQGAAHPVITHLEGAHALIGHVTVGAGDAGAGVHTLLPDLELGMLGLQELRPRLRVDPVREALLVVVRLDLRDAHAVGPRVGDNLALSLEVVLDVTLAAHERAHLLSRSVTIRVEVRRALVSLESLDPRDEAGARDTRRHGLGVMAVETGHGMLDEDLPLLVLHGSRLGVGHARDQLEAFLHVALAREAVERKVGGVTLQTRPRLLPLGHPPRLLLVEERVGVTAAIPIVDRESIAGEDAPEPWLLVELLLSGPPVAGSRPPAPIHGRRRQRRLEVGVVFKGPVLPPRLRIRRLFRHLDHPDEGLTRLLLALEDVGKEGQEEDGESAHGREGEDDGQPASRARRSIQ